MGDFRQAAAERRWRWAWLAVLVLGTAMQVWFWLRSVWIYLDQVDLYALGLALARDGELLPFGKLSTGGLPIPGVVLELLVGMPLWVWADMRSSTAVLVVFHLAAVLVLSRVLVRDFGWRYATVFLAILWLSPWRLFHSAFLWETNYLLLPAALHLATCRALKDQARIGASALLVATLLWTVQLHGSALILILTTVLLVARKRVRIHWGGAVAGGLIGAITLWPTIEAWLQGVGLPARPDTAGGLLMRLNSVEKTILYWFRLGSLDVGRRFRQSLYCIEPGAGDAVPQPLLCGLVGITQILALASVLVAVVASWWYLWRRRGQVAVGSPGSIDSWYRSYAGAMLASACLAALVSPVLIQGWHVLIVLPVACLPATAWILRRWPDAGSLMRAVLLLYLFWRIPASLLLLGHPMYAKPASPELPRHVAPIELRHLVPDVR